ncbi:MAG: sensor histidine kinase [Luteibaculum sp.]
MAKNQLLKSYLLFGLLFVYILAQFVWWGKSLYDRSYKLLLLQSQGLVSEEELSSLNFMVYGEGAVFVVILIVLLILAFRSISTEIKMLMRQKNFLLSVSHELKTPLATNRSIIQTLLTRDIAEDKKKELLQTLLEENKRFSDLVNNVFIAQRLEKGQFAVEKQRDDFSAFIKENLDRWKEISAPDSKLKSNLEAGINFPFDAQAMESVMLNLLSNAQKYSQSKLEIKVDLKRQNGILLTICDNGIGINKKNQALIFDRFYRVENEETRKTKGTGLGLYICKNIVQEHGGQISVESEPGKGTCIKIQFPEDGRQ